MRASICEGLEYLGIKLDPEKNNTRGEEAIISAADSKVTVWVIPTNEELMIAQDTASSANNPFHQTHNRRTALLSAVFPFILHEAYAFSKTKNEAADI